MQGIGNIVSGSNPIFFIPKSQAPQDQKVKYGRIVCVIKPYKDETHRTRLTIGVNLTEYPGEVTTPTEYITTAKIFINSTISTPDAIFFVQTYKLYLNTLMVCCKYMQLPLNIIPKEVIDEYNLTDIAHNGKVYI